MKIFFISLGALALAGTVDADAGPSAKSGSDDVTIISVAAAPFDSGVLHTASLIKASVRTIASGSKERTYLLSHLNSGQVEPRTGQSCLLKWSWVQKQSIVTAEGTFHEGRLVRQFDCRRR